jgi:hypothetical protein
MCDSANATLTLPTAAPHRIGTPSLSFLASLRSNFQLSIEDPDPVGTVNLFLFNVSTFKPSNMPTFFVLSSAFSYPYKLFCTFQNLNSFVFKQIRTLSQKHPGVGYLLPLYEDQNETANW